MVITYPQDHPAIPSEDHSSSSNRRSIPFSYGSPLQSPHRFSLVPDEPSSPYQPFLSTRVSILGSASECDSNSYSDSVSSKHSFSEDLNNYPPTPAFISASRSNSLDSGSLNYNQPISPRLLTRVSELGSDSGRDHNSSSVYFLSGQSEHSFSEDLNSSAPSLAFFWARLSTLFSGSVSYSQLHSPENLAHLAVMASHSASLGPAENRPVSPVTLPSSATLVPTCSACAIPMHGAFLWAHGTVYHLQCFRCIDCGDVVASKFFFIDGSDKQQPLCERDYFRRLDLICAKCGMALRGSYIKACNRKFHVEHFTCSICPMLFGPQDSYYEHDNDVYCHYHYSTRFATKCVSCNTAILKQFVKIIRDECWHPECYMINKLWNVKVVSRRPTSLVEVPSDTSESAYVEEEQRETSATLKEKQIRMEQQVHRIWTVLSAFEESSVACISDMLRYGPSLETIRMAEKFVLHVEALFATIDDLEWHFSHLSTKGFSHVREARMLCRKTVDLFTLLSHTQETDASQMGMNPEFLNVVTGLAHYLKILIRVALTGALKLEREHGISQAIQSFLDKLHLLVVQGGNPSACRMIERTNSKSGNAGTNGVTYGFRSLAPEIAGESPFLGATLGPEPSSVPGVNPPSDLCVKCNLTIGKDCVRLGTHQRWHSHCMLCMSCGKDAAPPPPTTVEDKSTDKEKDEDGIPAPGITTARRLPANADFFAYELASVVGTELYGFVPTVIYCADHAHPGCRAGFQAVSRLEQYAFLLNVALRRLYLLLRKRNVIDVIMHPIFQATQRDELLAYEWWLSSRTTLLRTIQPNRESDMTAHSPYQRYNQGTDF